MKFEKIYQLISGIVMPITFLFGFLIISSSLGNIGNPSVLFELFIFVCIIIYVIKSISFFRKNILQNMHAKPATKQLIYINGSFALIFFLQILIVFVALYAMPSTFKEMLSPFSHQLSSETGQDLSVDKIYSMLKGTFTVIFIYSVLLAVHVIMSFVLAKRYKHLFQSQG